MTDLMAMAPVLTFSALLLGSAIAIAMMLNEMSAMFHRLAGTDVTDARELRTPRTAHENARTGGADIVELPRRPRETISVKAGSPLPVAA